MDRTPEFVRFSSGGSSGSRNPQRQKQISHPWVAESLQIRSAIVSKVGSQTGDHSSAFAKLKQQIEKLAAEGPQYNQEKPPQLSNTNAGSGPVQDLPDADAKAKRLAVALPGDFIENVLLVLRQLTRESEESYVKKEQKRLQRQIERQDFFQRPADLQFQKVVNEVAQPANADIFKVNVIDKVLGVGASKTAILNISTSPSKSKSGGSKGNNPLFSSSPSSQGNEIHHQVQDDQAETRALASEAQTFLQMVEQERERTTDVSRRLASIQNTMSLMMQHVEQQDLQMDAIIDTGQQATAHIEQASKEFEKAKERSSGYQFYLMCWFLSAAFILLAMDAII
ncbi:unnamed protein product [Amoebophrya sp. A25]|nr:unnamed protein product [Amoebophrya sp. A25]|eukprot:GSA25T00015794001.1